MQYNRKAITLMDKITGETVTFTSQTAAAAHAHVSSVAIHKLMKGAIQSVNCGRYTLAAEEARHTLYWELYRAS